MPRAAAKKDATPEVVAETKTRTKFDPTAVSFSNSEPVAKRTSSSFSEDHPLYVDFKASYEGDQPHKLSTEDPETLIKGLRKLANQLDVGVSIIEQTEDSVTYHARPRRARKSNTEAADTAPEVDSEE